MFLPYVSMLKDIILIITYIQYQDKHHGGKWIIIYYSFSPNFYPTFHPTYYPTFFPPKIVICTPKRLSGQKTIGLFGTGNNYFHQNMRK